MPKLYKRVDDQLHYWETWNKDHQTGIVYKGIVGVKGSSKEVKSGLSTNFRAEIQKEMEQQMENGFQPIDIENHDTLRIAFKVDGMGTEEDVEKWKRLQNRMDATLACTGLGFCDGGTMLIGIMEVCCLVVDFEIAKNVVEKDLIATEFENYTRIYQEHSE